MAFNQRNASNRQRFKKNRDDIDHNHGGRDSGEKRKRQKNEVKFTIADDSSPIMKTFQLFQEELDNRNDRYERIVKLSRDITIESKRLIFLLQRVAGSDDRETLLSEAAFKLKELNASKFFELAQELDGQDPFQFVRAFSPGLQEYIEGVTFYHYLTMEKLIGIDKIQPDLTFTITVAQALESSSLNIQNTQIIDLTTKDQQKALSEENLAPKAPEEKFVSSSTKASAPEELASGNETRKISVPIPPTEYMLGVADFTGELMRMAINSVGAGDLEKPSVVANMMRVIHDAFTTFANPPRELRQKTRVLRQSLQKVETACYTLKVRGSEIPNHMLADVFTLPSAVAVDNFNEESEEVYD
ncbi:unnamed protein product [Lymnaea stagnalis]|uniref:Translin-associated protein X n=1 Tax=Lymnaea stagnalis TaxID=6523 RepID=A0AAV2HWH2_LYMST